MDKVNLVRVYTKSNKIISSNKFYEVPEEYRKNRKNLNMGISEALFANAVILVEGESERILFDAILSLKYPNYEVLGGYILVVDGIEFNRYIEILYKLNIKCIVKTDNDIKKSTQDNEKIQYDKLGLQELTKY